MKKRKLKKYEKTLTFKVLRQDLTFERTSENRITRAFVSKAKADRILRMLNKEVVAFTVVKGFRILERGYANREDLQTLIDRLTPDNKLDLTYNASGELKIVLERLEETLEGRAAV